MAIILKIQLLKSTGSRTMKLLTEQIKKQIPALYAQDGKGDDAIAYVKFFTPDAHITWYATEFNPDTGEFFGMVEGDVSELGYFSLKGLEIASGPLGLPVERDLYFKPTRIGDLPLRRRFA